MEALNSFVFWEHKREELNNFRNEINTAEQSIVFIFKGEDNNEHF